MISLLLNDNDNNGNMIQYRSTIIIIVPTAIATISAVLLVVYTAPSIMYQISTSSSIISNQEFRDALWFQIALLISLILLHQNIITLKTQNLESADIYADNSNNGTISGIKHSDSTNSDTIGSNSGSKDVILLEFTNLILELTYIQIFLALFVQIVSFQLHKYYQKCRKSTGRIIKFFISLLKVAMRSLVTSFLVFVYMIFFRCISHIHYINKNNNKTKMKINWEEIFLLFFCVWISQTLWILTTRQKTLKRLSLSSQQYYHQSNNGSILSGLPYQYANSYQEEEEEYCHFSHPPNENEWEQWTTLQLVCWIKGICYKQMIDSSTKRKQSFHNLRQKNTLPYSNLNTKEKLSVFMDEDIMIHIVETIKMQGINGSILPYIQVQDLVTMRIDYVHAVFLCIHFRSLIEITSTSMYDGTGTRMGDSFMTENEKGIEIDLDKWLGKKIGGEPTHKQQEQLQHNHPSNKSDIVHPTTNDSNNQLQEVTPNGVPSQYDHVKAMSENFGLELPELKQSSMNNGQNAASVAKAATIRKASISPSINQNPVHSNFELDPKLLNAMPPNIREIASRRPDLVKAMQEKFLHTKSQFKEPIQQPLSLRKRDKIVRFKEDVLNEKIASLNTIQDATLDRIDENASYEDSTTRFDTKIDETDEMVGLLRRRRVKL